MKFVYCDKKYSSGSSAPNEGTYFWGNCANTRWVVCYLNCRWAKMNFMHFFWCRFPTRLFAEASRSVNWLLIRASRKRATLAEIKTCPEFFRIRLCWIAALETSRSSAVRTRKCHFVGTFSSSCNRHVSSKEPLSLVDVIKTLFLLSFQDRPVCVLRRN